MKIIHIADVHLGMEPEKGSPLAKIRQKEIWDTFAAVLTRCREEQAELLLIAGDLFHRQPLVRELKEVSYLFSQIAPTQVVMMAGNHDYMGARSNYRDFVWPANVHMFDTEELDHVTFPEWKTTVYGLSYTKRDIREGRYDDCRPAGEGISVLLAHGGDRSHIPIDYRKLAEAGYTYVALGHIHAPHSPAPGMCYAGSLEPLDHNETGPHGYLRVTIQEGTEGYLVHTDAVPFSAREYRNLELTAEPADTNRSLLAKLKAEIEKQGEKHLYQVKLTGRRDAGMIPDPELLAEAGNVTGVTDETLPEYDLALLKRQHADDLIGRYIAALTEQAKEDVIAQKALYYGLEALFSED